METRLLYIWLVSCVAVPHLIIIIIIVVVIEDVVAIRAVCDAIVVVIVVEDAAVRDAVIIAATVVAQVVVVVVVVGLWWRSQRNRIAQDGRLLVVGSSPWWARCRKCCLPLCPPNPDFLFRFPYSILWLVTGRR